MKKDRIKGYILLLPAVLIMGVFVLYPILLTFLYSLQEFKLTHADRRAFIGLDNYRSILQSTPFWDAVLNTAFVVVLVVVLGLFCSIAVALLLHRKTRLSGFLTAVAIIPWALPPIVNGLLWKFIFYPGFGLVNKILYALQLVNEPVQWLNTRFGTLVIIGFIAAWRLIPFCALVFLANLQAIPDELYETASIDGAGRLRTFTDITLPLLIPSIAVMLTNLTINGISVFDEAVALVGYRTLSETLVIHNYNQTFAFLNIGYGSAITYLIMLASGLAGYFYIRGLSRGGAEA